MNDPSPFIPIKQYDFIQVSSIHIFFISLLLIFFFFLIFLHYLECINKLHSSNCCICEFISHMTKLLYVIFLYFLLNRNMLILPQIFSFFPLYLLVILYVQQIMHIYLSTWLIRHQSTHAPLLPSPTHAVLLTFLTSKSLTTLLCSPAVSISSFYKESSYFLLLLKREDGSRLLTGQACLGSFASR